LKKNVVGLIGILIVMSLTACSNKSADSERINVQIKQEAAGVEQEIENMADDLPKQQSEISQSETTVIENNNQDKAKVEQETENMVDDLPKQQGEISQSETTMIENDNQDKTIELYVNVLQNYLSAGKTDFTVSFIDLDDDNTREMVVFFGESQTDGGYLFTIKDAEAIHVLSEGSDCFGQYGGFTYKEKGNIFVTENESVSEDQISNQIVYYTMKNGNAICKDVTQSITQFDSDDIKFYVNDIEVESEKFNSIAENYGLLEMSTVSYSDGVPVVNGQMDMVYNAYNN